MTKVGGPSVHGLSALDWTRKIFHISRTGACLRIQAVRKTEMKTEAVGLDEKAVTGL